MYLRIVIGLCRMQIAISSIMHAASLVVLYQWHPFTIARNSAIPARPAVPGFPAVQVRQNKHDEHSIYVLFINQQGPLPMSISSSPHTTTIIQSFSAITNQKCHQLNSSNIAVYLPRMLLRSLHLGTTASRGLEQEHKAIPPALELIYSEMAEEEEEGVAEES